MLAPAPPTHADLDADSIEDVTRPGATATPTPAYAGIISNLYRLFQAIDLLIAEITNQCFDTKRPWCGQSVASQTY
jgi:hypothetical protein